MSLIEMGRQIKTLLFTILATFVILVFCEILAAIFLKFMPGKVTADDFRLARPDAYSKSPYFSKRFISESISSGSLFYTPKGTSLVLVKDKKGSYINTVNGDRSTVPRIVSKNKLYIFGGSTIFSGEVPDYYTIPSLLARLTEDYGEKKYEIINKGVTSVNVRQQLEYLKATGIKKDDIVIFYSGVNDVLQGLYFGNPEGTIVGEQRKNDTLKKENKIDQFLTNFNSYKLMKEFATDNYTPEHLKNKESAEYLIRKVAENYIKYTREAKQYVNSKGGDFINVLQPNLFVKDQNSKYEKWVESNVAFKGLRSAFLAGNATLAKANDDLKLNKVNTHNFTNIFNDLNEECYLDGYHVTELCNLRVALNMYGILFGKNITISERDFLNKVHQEYLDSNGKQYLYSDSNATPKSLVEKISSFVPERYFGSFDRESLQANRLSNGFFGFLHEPMEYYQVDISLKCLKKDTRAYLTVSSENVDDNFSERIPLECGSNTFNVKPPFVPTRSGIVIESNGEIHINTIEIYNFKN